MAFEPIWWATVQSRKNPRTRLASTLAMTMPEAWAMRRVTWAEFIREDVP